MRQKKESNTFKKIEQNPSKKVKSVTEKDFITFPNNLLEAEQIATLLGKSITRNRMTGMEQPAQILLPIT